MREPRLRYLFLRLSVIVIFILSTITITAQKVLVIDEDGEPLTGVEVYTSDYSFTSVTDLEGIVDLGEDNSIDALTFRYLGFQELSLDLLTIDSQEYVVIMTPVDLLIDEVVVFGRREVAQAEIPYQIATIKAKDIASTHAQTSADALAQHGGVFIQKSQMGGGSPLIRGFEANRVLLVVDGVRLNNAIYRSGHLQNAITVDQAILEKMDVIFGPNSLLYGSDALGGVVHFSTRSPKLSQSDKITTEVGYYARYASANKEKSIHADMSFGGKMWGSLTSVTVADYNDLRTGANRDDRFPDFGKRLTFQSRINQEDIAAVNEDPNIQFGTGYNQLDVAQKFLFVPNANHRLTANLHYSTSTDVPRYDNLNEMMKIE